MDDFW